MVRLKFFTEISATSENFLYRPKSAGRYAYLYKDPVVIKYQEDLKKDLMTQFKVDNIPPCEHICGLVTFFIFGVSPSSFYKKDTTNMIKATEDALFGTENSLFEPDDSMVTSSAQRKVVSDTDFVYIDIGLLTSEQEYDASILVSMIQDSYDKDIYKSGVFYGGVR